MRIFSFLLISLLFTVSGYAQGQQQEAEYSASMDGWLVSLDEAMARSAETGKPILANFTGSDWCGWCIRLKREVFVTPEFKQWAAENVVLLELDFPRRFQLPDEISQQNRALAQAFGIRGYPTIWVFYMTNNPENNQRMITPLAQTGYMSGPEAFIKDIEAKIAKAKADQQEQAQKQDGEGS